MRNLVTAGVAAHRADPKLHRVLAEQLPRTGNFDSMRRTSHFRMLHLR